jgi:hypothetical protein
MTIAAVRSMFIFLISIAVFVPGSSTEMCNAKESALIKRSDSLFSLEVYARENKMLQELGERELANIHYMVTRIAAMAFLWVTFE